MISKLLAFFTGSSKEPSRKRSQLSSAYDEERDQHAKRRKAEVKPNTWMPWLSFAGMADWVEQRKLSFADSFYYKTTDQTDRRSRMTNMSSSPPQCDPLVARDSSFLSGGFVAPKSSSSGLTVPKSSFPGYQFPSLVNPTVTAGNSFKFGTATDVEFKAPLSQQKAAGMPGGSGYRPDPYTHGPRKGTSLTSKLLGRRRSSRFLPRQQNHAKLTAEESIHMEQRNIYAQLIQHYSKMASSPIDLTAAGEDGQGGDGGHVHSRPFNLSLANATSENCTLLGTSIAPHGLTALKTEPARPSRAPAKPMERGGGGLKHAPVKSRTAAHKLTVAKEHIISSPQKRRNISRPVTKTLDKPEVIDLDSDSDENSKEEVEIIEVKKAPMPPPKSPAASFFEKSFQGTKFVNEQWIKDFNSRYTTTERIRCKQIEEEEAKLGYYSSKRGEWEDQLTQRIEHKLSISERVPVVLEEEEYVVESSEEEEEEEEEVIDEFPELTEEQEDLVDRALGPYVPSEVLADAFRLQITRRDMATLSGLNWLNDEIINFYMNLLMDRGSKSSDEGGTGFKVHAFNTFFYPKIMSAGHAGVRRWTRKMDIFAVDFILVPVHLGMHWCLAVVDFGRREIRYYDSMGGSNNTCLNKLKEYLMAESEDKKKQEFDMTGWKLINVKDIPQQMNGSDCGMFSCKYAEYVTRNAPINFIQEHMPYFRRRMVYEILTQKLM